MGAPPAFANHAKRRPTMPENTCLRGCGRRSQMFGKPWARSPDSGINLQVVSAYLPRLATNTVLAPKLGEFVRDYPDIVLDVTTDDSRMDIVAEGFNAGIHFGEYIERLHDRF